MDYRRVWAEINLAHLTHNLRAVRARIPAGTRLMGIVKADAYGHGAVPVAQALLAQGVDALGVAICEEGFALRDAGIDAPVLVMGFTPDPLLDKVVRQGLAQTVFSPVGATALSTAAARVGKKARVHIKIDTGMSRLGFLPTKESVAAICAIARDPHLDVQGIYTHCATSDALDNSFVFTQRERFCWILQELEACGLHIMLKHMANSGAVAQTLRNDPPTDLFMDMVRVGILLYGLPPSREMTDVCDVLSLKPVMRLISQVSMVKELPAGVGISYGHHFVTPRPTTIAVLPVGYADGYPRRLTYGGRVLIKGQYAPIAGAICMDQCMVDVTDITGGVVPGEPVTLLGSPAEGISADDLADIVGTISYEVVCGVGKRVPRIYSN